MFISRSWNEFWAILPITNYPGGIYLLKINDVGVGIGDVDTIGVVLMSL